MLNRSHILFLILLFFVSCADNVPNESQPQNTATAVIEMTNTPLPPTITPTTAPTPTPTIPNLAVADQIITDDGQLTIASVVSNEPGWVVVYGWQNGELGDVLGYTAVARGEQQ